MNHRGFYNSLITLMKNKYMYSRHYKLNIALKTTKLAVFLALPCLSTSLSCKFC